MSIAIENQGNKSAVIKMEFDDDGSDSTAWPEFARGAPLHDRCLELTPQGIRSSNGRIDLVLDEEESAALFPRLMTNLPPGAIALLLATTRLVGMRCPGLNSIFSEIHLSLDSTEGHDVPSLAWRNEEFDDRFNLTTISLAATGVKGALKAFIRPVPQAQPCAKDIQNRVPGNFFRQRRALVFGGSRGIGEVCAKILAAGGADVRLTYHCGAEDAAHIVADVTSIGGCATAFAFDALAPPSSVLADNLGGWFPTHVYYFPTPSIFGSAVSGKFAHEKFFNFYDFYVRGAANVHAELRSISNQSFEFFYASSVFLDDVPANMGEYAAAKAAGEALCHFLSKTDSNLNVRIERLPRLPTDQTVNIYVTNPHEATVDIVGTLFQILTGDS